MAGNGGSNDVAVARPWDAALWSFQWIEIFEYVGDCFGRSDGFSVDGRSVVVDGWGRIELIERHLGKSYSAKRNYTTR